MDIPLVPAQVTDPSLGVGVSSATYMRANVFGASVQVDFKYHDLRNHDDCHSTCTAR